MFDHWRFDLFFLVFGWLVEQIDDIVHHYHIDRHLKIHFWICFMKVWSTIKLLLVTVSVFDKAENLLDSSRHYTSLWALASLKRKRLSASCRPKECDTGVAAFNKVMNNGSNILRINFILSSRTGFVINWIVLEMDRDIKQKLLVVNSSEWIVQQLPRQWLVAGQHILWLLTSCENTILGLVFQHFVVKEHWVVSPNWRRTLRLDFGAVIRP